MNSDAQPSTYGDRFLRTFVMKLRNPSPRLTHSLVPWGRTVGLGVASAAARGLSGQVRHAFHASCTSCSTTTVAASISFTERDAMFFVAEVALVLRFGHLHSCETRSPVHP